jgi:hypothetical protein
VIKIVDVLIAWAKKLGWRVSSDSGIRVGPYLHGGPDNHIRITETIVFFEIDLACNCKVSCWFIHFAEDDILFRARWAECGMGSLSGPNAGSRDFSHPVDLANPDAFDNVKKALRETGWREYDKSAS